MEAEVKRHSAVKQLLNKVDVRNVTHRLDPWRQALLKQVHTLQEEPYRRWTNGRKSC